MRLLLFVCVVTAGITGGATHAVRGGFVYGGADILLRGGGGGIGHRYREVRTAGRLWTATPHNLQAC